MKKRFLSTGILFMVLVAMLAALGVGYAQWQQTLTINGTVTTGNVDAEFTGACTDDDGVVTCPPGILGLPKDVDDTGLDPAASGEDPKPRYTRDVALCEAAIVGPLTATITKTNVYPSYYCTAWFDVHNSGSIPVKVASATVNGVPVTPSVPTPFDISGDTVPDVEIHLTGLDPAGCQQIEPSETVQIDIDQHILPDAPPSTPGLSYTVEVVLQAWNQPCP